MWHLRSFVKPIRETVKFPHRSALLLFLSAAAAAAGMSCVSPQRSERFNLSYLIPAAFKHHYLFALSVSTALICIYFLRIQQQHRGRKNFFFLSKIFWVAFYAKKEKCTLKTAALWRLCYSVLLLGDTLEANDEVQVLTVSLSVHFLDTRPDTTASGLPRAGIHLWATSKPLSPGATWPLII